MRAVSIVMISALVITALPCATKLATTPESFVEKRNSPARGLKTCLIRQRGDSRANIQIRVYPDGSAGISVREDSYPGTSAFFLIGGKRYSGPGSKYVPLDSAAIAALSRQMPIDYSWNDWPYKSEHNQKTIIARFSDLFAECRTFHSEKP